LINWLIYSIYIEKYVKIPGNLRGNVNLRPSDIKSGTQPLESRPPRKVKKQTKFDKQLKCRKCSGIFPAKFIDGIK